MPNLELTIHGRIPSKKNSRLSFVRGGKMFNIPSKNYKIWHQTASDQLSGVLLPEPIHTVENVTLSFYAPDKRKADLTNKAESIMDLLVDNGFLEDDNWFIVKSVTLKYIDIDRKEPRCLIQIQY